MTGIKTNPRLASCTLPQIVLNGCPHIVYHWTIKKHLGSIAVFGLMRGSFVTQDPRHYRGEVLLGVCMDKAHDWERMKDWTPRPEDSTWQAIFPEPVPPERIFIIQNPTGQGMTHETGKKD